MLYSCLKIIHILGATVLLMTMAYCIRLWREIQFPQHNSDCFDRIQSLTWLVIVPVSLILLVTGFTIISVQHESFSQLWVTGSALGFIVLIASWFSFIYFLVLSLQTSDQMQGPSHSFAKFKFLRHAQSVLLSLCAISIFTMIFFMANKIT